MIQQIAAARPLTHNQRLTAIAFILASTLATDTFAAGTTSDFGKDLDRTTSLHHFQVDKEEFIGQRFEFDCPSVNVRDKTAALYGTNVYPANSPICIAAQHAGVVGTGGGRIELQLNPGVEGYRGSSRNGVESGDLPGTKLSIMFLSEATRAELDQIQKTWRPRLKWDDKFSQTGLANIRLTGQRFAFECPAAPGNLAGRVVYGTDVYPLGSMVCLTAVHAGQITRAGGPVLIQMEPEISGSFVGSIRHGIESRNGPRTPRSISFPGSAMSNDVAMTTPAATGHTESVPVDGKKVGDALKKAVRLKLD